MLLCSWTAMSSGQGCAQCNEALERSDEICAAFEKRVRLTPFSPLG